MNGGGGVLECTIGVIRRECRRMYSGVGESKIHTIHLYSEGVHHYLERGEGEEGKEDRGIQERGVRT